MPPKQRTTRPQTKKSTPKAKTTGSKAKASTPKARTPRPLVTPEAPPDPEQDAPGAAPPDLALILPAEDPLALDQGPPEAANGGPAFPQATDIVEVHYTAENGLHTAENGLQEVYLSPPLQEMTVAWPSIQRMLAWWQDRERAMQEPPGPLERVTYHVAPQWIAAVKREADLTGESYAAIVNRAVARYFAGR